MNMLNKSAWPLYSLNRRRNQINTNPDYQRPSVWTKNQKQLLMDSILHDYDIPKIYLHEVEKEKYDVVDGQQRIGNKYKQKLKACISKSVLYDNGKVVNHWNTGDLHYYENFEQIKENLD